MASASWRRHFSVDEGLDKYPAIQIKRAHIDDHKIRQGHHSTLNLREMHSTTPRSGYTSDGSSSGFHTNRSRDLSEEIHLPSGLRALSDEISDVSGSRYHGGDELDSEECSNAPRKTSDNWRTKFDLNYEGKYKPSRYSDESTGKDRNRNHHEKSWGFMNSDDFTRNSPSVTPNASYTDLDGATSSTSGSLFVPPRYKNARASPNSRMSSTLEINPRRKGQRVSGESPDGTRTSGYASNNTYSEMSDFTNHNKSNDHRNFMTLPGKSKQEGGRRDNENYSSRRPRDGHHQRRTSNTLDDRALRDGAMYNRSMSANDSDVSLSSKDRSSKSTEKEKRGSSNSLDSKHHHHHQHQSETKTQKVPTIGNVSVTVTNNIQYDPNDPFSFIQPIDLPFHKQVRKCMGPIAAIVLLLILAAALGAAIYFASELKDTQETQIDLLRANLAMKIRNTDAIPNIESLTSQDIKNISRTYCKQMDLFYIKSQFKETYRGCEVLSFQNDYINFTLFFVEKEATSSQIIGVIESSANKTKNASQTFAVVDKFELVLESVRVTMERRMEPETFDKKTLPEPKPAPPVPTGSSANDGNQDAAQATKSPTTARIPYKATPKNKPVYSWRPCEEGYNGDYFPHPTDCDKFFHCSNRISILRVCSPENLYQWEKFACVTKWDSSLRADSSEAVSFANTSILPLGLKELNSGVDRVWVHSQAISEEHRRRLLTPPPSKRDILGRRGDNSRRCPTVFTPNIQCPDPNKAPRRPTTTPTTTTVTAETTTDPFFDDFDSGSSTEGSTRPSKIQNGQSKSALAGQYSGRPKYSATPCKQGADGQLYGHPNDCAKFIQCVNGKEMLMNCSGGLVFDPATSACKFPPNPELVCPDIQPCKNLANGYFPHPFDCTKFIQCQARKEKVLSCGAGLVWNPNVNSCIHEPNSPLCNAGTRR